MRALAASLTLTLGLGALLTMGACSDSTDEGSGGAAGASGGTSTAGKGGGSATAGSGGEAGMADLQCKFLTTGCQTCISMKCGMEYQACAMETACAMPLGKLAACVCDEANTTSECQTAFVGDGGDVAEALANCYVLNCEEACQ